MNLEHERLRPLSVEDIDDLNTANNEIGKPDGTKPIYFFMDKIQAMEGGADR
jgi:hypothetical protein